MTDTTVLKQDGAGESQNLGWLCGLKCVCIFQGEIFGGLGGFFLCSPLGNWWQETVPF